MLLIRNSLRAGELLCLLAGTLLLGFFLAQMVRGEVERLDDLEQTQLAWNAELPDTSLWSPGRIEAWHASQSAAPADVVAILEMPDVGLKVPVYRGADDLNMDRGAGLIQGTAAPGTIGNMGIAGHRDGYFRVLKDAEVGDLLTVQTPAGRQQYRVEDILIVDPIDVDVLDPTDDQQLTLVTCYPFYFVGHAPQRYIVKARLHGET